MEAWPTSAFQRRITALLAYYRGLDDDAALAYYILRTQGLPQRVAGDFRPHWGINPGLENAVKFDVIPDTIPPLPQEIVEIREALLARRPPGIVSLEPTWSPFRLPPGYVHTITQCVTYARPGVGELALRLVHHSDIPLSLEVLNVGEDVLAISSALAARLGFQVFKWLPVGLNKVSVQNGGNNWIGFNKSAYTDQPELLYGVLVGSGCFPIWDLQKVQPDSMAEWEKHREEFAAKFPYTKETKDAAAPISQKGYTVLFER